MVVASPLEVGGGGMLEEAVAVLVVGHPPRPQLVVQQWKHVLLIGEG
jgi:hypothetical protein